MRRDLMAAAAVLALSVPIAAQGQPPEPLPPGSIWVVTEPGPGGPDSPVAGDPWRNSVPGSLRGETVWSAMEPSKLAASLGDLATQLDDVMSAIESAFGSYALTQIEVSLVISADGSVGILGTGGTVGASGGIKLVLSR